MRSGAWRLNHHQTGEDGKQESITISEVPYPRCKLLCCLIPAAFYEWAMTARDSNSGGDFIIAGIDVAG